MTGAAAKLDAPHPRSPVSERLVRVVERFEHVVAFTLVALLMVVVVLVSVDVAHLLVKDLFLARGGWLEPEQIFELFGSFLLVLVGMELLTSLRAYVQKGTVHMEVVLEVALIALAQKVIILNPRSDPLAQVGLASLIIALGGSFWAVRAARRRHHGPASRIRSPTGARGPATRSGGGSRPPA